MTKRCVIMTAITGPSGDTWEPLIDGDGDEASYLTRVAAEVELFELRADLEDACASGFLIDYDPDSYAIHEIDD